MLGGAKGEAAFAGDEEGGRNWSGDGDCSCDMVNFSEGCLSDAMVVSRRT